MMEMINITPEELDADPDMVALAEMLRFFLGGGETRDDN